MELNLPPESQRIVDYLKVNTKSVNTSLTLQEIRVAYNERSRELSGYEKEDFDGTRDDILVPSSDVKDGIHVFVYTPSNLSANPAIVVWCHGGGLVFGSRLLCDTACKRISSLCGCILVNVEYRLAPENKFPAMFDDAATVVDWVMQNKEKIGGCPKSKVGIGGDSGGGVIAASIAHDHQVDFQILVYPNVLRRGYFDVPSMQKYKDGPVLTLGRNKWLTEQVVPPSDRSNPRLCSILRPRFDGLPPALFIIHTHQFRSMYADKLKENGISVEVHEFKGALHAFFCYAAYCPGFTSEAYSKVSRFIQKFQ